MIWLTIALLWIVSLMALVAIATAGKREDEKRARITSKYFEQLSLEAKRRSMEND